MSSFDCVIREVLIMDGSGGAAFVADVAIKGERISDVGAFEGRGNVEISGRNLCLCPGFIDVHGHDDFAPFIEPTLAHKVLQGVTTVVVGNCGIGPAPARGARSWIERLHPGTRMPEWDGYREYLERIAEAGPALNWVTLAGHGSIREAFAPGVSRTLSSEEFSRVERGYDEALEAGVFGLSSGLIYEPGCHADANELVWLLRRGKETAPLYATHLRNEADELLPAVSEAIFIAAEAEVGLQLSHHKAHGRNNWGRVKESLALVDEARARRNDVWLDVYPYTAGSTILSALVEVGAFTKASRLGTLAPEDIVLSSVRGHSAWDGKSLRAVMSERSLSKEAAADYVLGLDPGAWVVVFAMSEEDVRYVLSHPQALIGSDGLPISEGKPHPRLWGTFPRVFGHYARELRLFALEEAVAKMSRRAAERFQIPDRGVIAKGAFADLVLFDPQIFIDQATFGEPRLPPLGLSRVWVNGVLTVDAGELTKARAGRVLRREN